MIMLNHIIIIFQSDSASGVDFNLVGSSLLAILDDYAFNYIERDTHFLLENIGKVYNLHIYLNLMAIYINIQLS